MGLIAHACDPSTGGGVGDQKFTLTYSDLDAILKDVKLSLKGEKRGDN